MITLSHLHIKTEFKNFKNFEIDFSKSKGVTVLIGNNGSGKSNIIEAISSIFAGLYNHYLDPEFSYELTYIRDDKEIVIQYNHTKSKDKYTFNNISEGEYLPTQVIGLYSGEELRLWERYYYNFYDAYNKGVLQSKIGILENMPMLFLNKHHWDIALLTMLKSDLELNDVLGDKQITTVHFKFDRDAVKNIKEFNSKNPNEVTRFAKKILETTIGGINNESGLIDIEFPIEIFKAEFVQTHNEFFKLLSVALLPKDNSWRLISSIELWFKDNFSAKELSEGEKKLLLIKFITRILSDNDSVFLLDEPDSHIHINNKEHIKKYLYGTENEVYVESILTTHSPTLSACFNNENLYMLNNGKLVEKEKQAIIDELTEEFWNKQQQNSFLSSTKHIVLFVEGKHDKIHITNALRTLKEEYPNLDFDIYNMNGADDIEHIMKGLYTSEIEHKQVYIAILDDDDSGQKVNKELCEKCKNLPHFKSFMYPKKRVNKKHKGSFTVENMFDMRHYKKAYRKAVSTFEFSISSINKISENVQKCAKACLVEDSELFLKEDYKYFRLLFDKINKLWEEYSGTGSKKIEKSLDKESEKLVFSAITNLPKVIQKETLKKQIEFVDNVEKSKVFWMALTEAEILLKSEFEYEKFFINSKGINAESYYYPEKSINVLLKGTTVVKETTTSCLISTIKLRSNAFASKLLTDDGEYYTLTKSISFTTPSPAASFVLGSNSNGWKSWKNPEGKTLDECYPRPQASKIKVVTLT